MTATVQHRCTVYVHIHVFTNDFCVFGGKSSPLTLSIRRVFKARIQPIRAIWFHENSFKFLFHLFALKCRSDHYRSNYKVLVSRLLLLTRDSTVPATGKVPWGRNPERCWLPWTQCPVRDSGTTFPRYLAILACHLHFYSKENKEDSVECPAVAVVWTTPLIKTSPASHTEIPLASLVCLTGNFLGHGVGILRVPVTVGAK